MSFNALNWAVTQAVLDREFAGTLAPVASPDAQPGSDAQPSSDAEVARTEINRYSIVSGFLTSPWGLVLPYLVMGRIHDLVDPKGSPADPKGSPPPAAVTYSSS